MAQLTREATGLLFRDQFNRANAVEAAANVTDPFDDAATLDNYTASGGATWTVSGGVLTGEGGTGAFLLRNGVSVADCWVEAELDHAHDGGLVLRMSPDMSQYYLLIIRDDSGADGTKNIELVRYNAAAYTYIGTAVNIAWARGAVKRFRFTAIGPHFLCHVDGALVFARKDTVVTAAGGVGIRQHSSAAGQQSRYLSWAYSDQPIGSKLGANWVDYQGSFVLEANEVKRPTGGPDHDRTLTRAIAPRRDMVVQSVVRMPSGTTFPAIMGRWEPEASEDAYLAHIAESAGTKYFELYKRLNDAWTKLAGVSTSFVYGNPVTLKLALKENSQRAWKDGGELLSATNADLSGTLGYAGLRAGVQTSADAFWDDFAICESNNITARGLPTGYKLRVAGVTSAASDGQGDVVLDTLGAVFPATVEVLDGAGAVVLSDADGWGGDTYLYSSTLLTRPTVSLARSDNGNLATLTLTGSAASAPASHDASEWRLVKGDEVLYESGVTLTDLTSHAIAPENQPPAAGLVRAQVRYRDTSGTWTDWSEPSPEAHDTVLDDYGRAVQDGEPHIFVRTGIRGGELANHAILPLATPGPSLTLKSATRIAAGKEGRGIRTPTPAAAGVTFADAPGEVREVWTFECWVKPKETTALGTSNSGSERTLVYSSYGPAVGVGHIGLGLAVGTNGFALFQHAANNVAVASKYVGALSSTEWNHIVVRMWSNSADNYIAALYLNGVFCGDIAGGTYTQWTTSSTAIMGFILGQPSTSTMFGLAFDGDVDEIAWYTKPLYPAQIADHYRAGTSVGTAPTVTISGIGDTTATVTGSAYVSPDGTATHAATRLLIYDADDTYAIIYDSGDVAPATTFNVTGLPVGRNLTARLRYQHSTGEWSPAGAASFATTNSPPATPTIKAVPRYHSVRLTGSAYSDPNGDAHKDTRWVVRRADTQAIVHDTDWQAERKTAITIKGLTQGVAYEAAVQYRDVVVDVPGVSALSAWAPFTTGADPAFNKRSSGLLYRNPLGVTLSGGGSIDVAAATDIPASYVMEVDVTGLDSGVAPFENVHGGFYWDAVMRPDAPTAEVAFDPENINGTIFWRPTFTLEGVANSHTTGINYNSANTGAYPSRVEVREGEVLRAWQSEHNTEAVANQYDLDGKASTGALTGATAPAAVRIVQRAGATNRFDRARFYSSRFITVKDVPLGHWVEVFDGQDRRVARKRQSTTDATLDVLVDMTEAGVPYDGHYLIRVSEDRGDGLDAGTMVMELDPVDGIAGGDVYSTVPPPVPLETEPCSLELTVYDTDGVTELFSVGTGIGHAAPYLMEPTQYGSQEVDFVKGGASLTQVNVTVIDPAQAGDQDAGWMTERLAGPDGLPKIQGLRSRLRRYAGADGWVTIADGPNGPPSLHESYAAFKWAIRDSREYERKLKAFDRTTRNSVLPPGVVNGFGNDGAAWIVAPMVPLEVTVVSHEGGVWLDLEPNYWPTVSTALPEAKITDLFNRAYEPVITPTVLASGNDGYTFTWPNVMIFYRLDGSTGSFLGVTLPPSQSTSAIPPDWYRGRNATIDGVADQMAVYRIRVPMPTTPAIGTAYEAYVVYVGTPSKDAPLHLETTAGQLLADLYDGKYSPMEDTDGDGVGDTVVPTGIRYDAAAIAALTQPILARVSEPITDIREWAEKYVYRPLGYAPALDTDLRISPVSQAPPVALATLEALTVIDNAAAEPAPGWAEQANAVNTLVFKYPRWYKDAEAGNTEGVSEREIEVVYINRDSVERLGEKRVEIDGRMFGAIGTDETGELRAGTQEEGAQLALERKTTLFDRRKWSTPVATVRVRRSVAVNLRPGSWVRLKLSWMPNYATRRRSLDHLAQVLQASDLDCAWRELTLEIVRTWEEAVSTTLERGTSTATALSNSEIQLDATAPTGGATPYTYQWYRSTVANEKGVALAGYTALSRVDGALDPDTTFYYILEATEAGGGKVDYYQVNATTLQDPIVLNGVALVDDAADTVRAQFDVSNGTQSVGVEVSVNGGAYAARPALDVAPSSTGNLTPTEGGVGGDTISFRLTPWSGDGLTGVSGTAVVVSGTLAV